MTQRHQHGQLKRVDRGTRNAAAGVARSSEAWMWAKRHPRVWFQTFGCQMNKLDAELLRGDLLANGFIPATDINSADAIFFMTCSVRQHAEDRVYSRLGSLKQLKKRRPEVIVGVLGCMAQKDRYAIIRRVPHVDLVCGTRDMFRLRELIGQTIATGRPIVAGDGEAPPQFHRHLVYRQEPRHHAYVSIMRGCDNYCAYCIVPYVRGREASRKPGDIIEECRHLVDDGCKEITLLGQNVNSYGRGLKPAITFPELLGRIDGINGLSRLRFVTSHPKDATRELFAAMDSLETVCEHIHLPPQSGSDRILKAMNRHYTSEHYRELVAMARGLVNGLEVTADFIVGFPGETDGDFECTAQLMRDVKFINSFIFKYSPRPGTAAAKLPDDVTPEVKAERNHLLLELQSEISTAKNAAMVGQTVEMLVEGTSKRDATRLTGRTRGNHIVVFPANGLDLTGELVRVKIVSATALTLFGRVV